MSKCVSGHENPVGAVYCITCGKDLSLDAAAIGRQCTHGHSMLSHEETCKLCGNLPFQEKVGVNASSSARNKMGTIAKLELSDMRVDAKETLHKIRKQLRNNLKIISLVLALAIVIPSTYFGYTITSGPNYKGKTIEEVFKGREDKITSVLQPTCSITKSGVAEAEAEIVSTTNAIAADYHYALDLNSTLITVDEVREKIRKEVERQLKTSLGESYTKLIDSSAVTNSGVNEALSFCQLDGILIEMEPKASALNAAITSIKAPGSWAPPEYYYDGQDPNIAYKFAPRSAFPNGGWAVDIVSRLGCSGGGTVTIEGLYGTYSGSSVALSPNQSARVNVYTNLDYISETGISTYVSCDATGSAAVVEPPDKPKPEKKPIDEDDEFVEEDPVEEDPVEEDPGEDEWVEDPCYVDYEWIC